LRHLRLDYQGPTAVLAFDRPPVNAFDLEMILSLEQAFLTLAQTPPVGGLVLTGAGSTFSAGVDIKTFSQYGPQDRRALVLAISRMIRAYYALPCPTVAAVNGHALGGGFVFVLASDQRLAYCRAEGRLGLPEAAAGIPFPAGPLVIITRELAPDRQRRLALGGSVVHAAELVELGILDGAEPAKDLVAQAIVRAQALARQKSYAAVKAQLRADALGRIDAIIATNDDPHMDAFLSV
jgi:enoyl-CoA hydratase